VWRKIRVLLAVLVLVAVVLVGLLIGIDNQAPTALRLLDLQSPAWPLSWWLALAFAVGALAGLGACLASLTRGKFRLRRLNRTLAQREREIDRLQTLNSPSAAPKAPANVPVGERQNPNPTRDQRALDRPP